MKEYVHFLIYSICVIGLAAYNGHTYGWLLPLPIVFLVLIAITWRKRRNMTTSEQAANRRATAPKPNERTLEAPSRIYTTVAAGLVVTVYVVARLLNVDSGSRAAFVIGAVVLVTAVTGLRFYVRGSR